MKFNKLVTRIAASLLISAVALSGCAPKEANETQQASADGGEQSGGTTKLRIYAQYSDDDTKLPYDYAVAELKKEMPNIELELDIQAQDDGQKLKTYAATGNMPDIYNVGLDQINTFIKSNNITVLNDYAKEFGYTDKVYESTENILYHPDGNIYAFPYAGHEMVLLYVNKEIFETNNVKIPETYDELLTAIEQFNAVGITPLSIFAKEKWPCVALYDMLVTRFVPSGIKGLDTGETKATDEGYVEAAKRLEELISKGLVQKGATNMNYDQARSLFYTGGAAMFLNGQWEIEDSTKNLGDKVDWIPFPAASADKIESSRYAFSGSGNVGGYAVSPSTKDAKLAAQVAAFISEKYAEFKYTQRANPIVAVKVDKPIEKEYPPMMTKLSEYLPKTTGTTAFAWGIGNSNLKVTLEDECQRIIAGNYSTEDFIQAIEKAQGK